MYLKTEKHDLSPAFLLQISLLALFVLAVVMFFTRFLADEKATAVQDTQTLLFPWLVAARRTLENGLRAFGGKSPQFVPMNEIGRSLAALLISSVICPTVFLLEWRRRRLSSDPGESRPQLSLSVVFYGVCTAMTLYVAIALFPMAVTGEMVRTNVRASQEIMFNRDEIINEINMMATKAHEYYLMPEKLGGGGRSFKGLALPQSTVKTDAAQYVTTPARKEIVIRASSIPFSDCWVETTLDSTGRLGVWTYGGRFR